MNGIMIELRGGPADGRRENAGASCSVFEVIEYGDPAGVVAVRLGAPVSSRVLTYLRTADTADGGAVIFDWFDHDDPRNVVLG